MSVASPCINICHMSPDTGWCEGCQRNIDEITRWSRASDADRHQILLAVADRRELLGLAPLAQSEGARV
ncbi:MAG: DUF1289 domain-containing protein [Azoarcus sp.]|nr:DUF1289 domain-containing protein [Azoarcus sp.]MDD2872439.1 DUF1289 domain-containing protein [Azoarcus sp.]MDX9836923.1 DUF1289 domain-containing protein [Azoarcus sp.]